MHLNHLETSMYPATKLEKIWSLITKNAILQTSFKACADYPIYRNCSPQLICKWKNRTVIVTTFVTKSPVTTLNTILFTAANIHYRWPTLTAEGHLQLPVPIRLNSIFQFHYHLRPRNLLFKRTYDCM